MLKKDMCIMITAKPFSSYEGLNLNKEILKYIRKCHFPTFQTPQ